MSTASNHSIYAIWTANTYTITLDGHKYENGTPIYFNPVTGQKCTISDYTESQSATGVKTGCMKWYVFLDSKDSSTVNLILDHNTTGMVAWNSNSSGTTPDTINAQLQTDVSNWNTNIKSTARLISASEINQIAPKNGTWNKNDYNTWYYLYNGSTTQYTGVAGSNPYGWLFDNTATCTTYGCNKYDTGTNGYWTSDFASSGNAWCINYGGVLFYGGVIYDYIVGVRPVIEVDKSILGTNGTTTKTVTYDSTYGELPTLTKDGYTFQGWYTTGGVKIESTTKVTNTSNHTLYAQWSANTYTVTLNASGGIIIDETKNYQNGQIVYFNPVTGASCTSSDYTASQSATGVKTGCMKWYAFLDDGEDTVNLILDHNTSLSIDKSCSSVDLDTELYPALQSDTSAWNNSINNIRLISAEEVSEITGVSVPYGGKDYNPLPAEYSWIYNSDGSRGYITSTRSNDNQMMVNVVTEANYHTSYAMFSYYTDGCGSNGDDNFGVRPVIEVNKNLLGATSTTSSKTFGSAYGTLPTPIRDGYTFQGWYTTGGVKVESTTALTNASNHTLYAQWTANSYTVTLVDDKIYNNGEVVYFNPVTGAACSSSGYTTSQSNTGVKTGCMKWYAFLDDGGNKVKLLLDHNTSSTVAWSTSSTGTTPDKANSQLASDVSGWNTNVKSTARLISAVEINQIAPKTGGWSQTNSSHWYSLHNGSQTAYKGSIGTNKYAWLFDSTYLCGTYGCNNSLSSGPLGYWTSSSLSSTLCWGVYKDGNLSTDYKTTSTVSGVRPVIEIDKSLLGMISTTKEVTYGSAYGELPTPTRDGYTFQGWYTAASGGTQVTSTTQVTTASNHTLYAQWTTMCFVAGTKVYTEDGYKNIEDIKVGEKVYSYNLLENKLELKEVERTITSSADITYKMYVGNDILEMSERHQIYIVDKGWVRAYNIKIGDLMIDMDGNYVEITNIEKIVHNSPIPTYNLTTKDNHNFYVGNIRVVVHNALSSPTPH